MAAPAFITMALASALQRNAASDLTGVVARLPDGAGVLVSELALTFYRRQTQTEDGKRPLVFELSTQLDIHRILGIVALARTLALGQKVLVAEVSSEPVSKIDIFAWVHRHLLAISPNLANLWDDDVASSFYHEDAVEEWQKYNFSRALHMLYACALCNRQINIMEHFVRCAISLPNFNRLRFPVVIREQSGQGQKGVKQMRLRDIIIQFLRHEIIVGGRLRDDENNAQTTYFAQTEYIINILETRLLAPGKSVIINPELTCTNTSSEQNTVPEPFDSSKSPCIAGCLFWGLWPDNLQQVKLERRLQAMLM